MVSVCLPSDALCNIYPLTWVSLTLDIGYLFTAGPTKRSRYSLPWTRGISSPPPLLTLDLGLLLWAATPSLGQKVAPLGCSCAFTAWHSHLLPLTVVAG